MGSSSWVAASLTAAALLVGCPERKLGGYMTPLPDGAPVEDPVSGAICRKDAATEAAVFSMRTFYFCSDTSRAAFGENPERYAYR